MQDNRVYEGNKKPMSASPTLQGQSAGPWCSTSCDQCRQARRSLEQPGPGAHLSGTLKADDKPARLQLCWQEAFVCKRRIDGASASLMTSHLPTTPRVQDGPILPNNVGVFLGLRSVSLELSEHTVRTRCRLVQGIEDSLGSRHPHFVKDDDGLTYLFGFNAGGGLQRRREGAPVSWTLCDLRRCHAHRGLCHPGHAGKPIVDRLVSPCHRKV
jgi:hypothetical protein